MTDTRLNTKDHHRRPPAKLRHLAPVEGTRRRVWLRPRTECLVCLQPLVRWQGEWQHVGGQGR